MNLLLEQLHLHVGAMEHLATLAEKEGATLEGGAVADAEAALGKIAEALAVVDDVVTAMAGKRMESGFDDPVPYELVKVPEPQPVMTSLARIAAERTRQIEAEGWTDHHDDGYTKGELARAAHCYADVAGLIVLHSEGPKPIVAFPPCFIHRDWPWDKSWWKPALNPMRNLEKAGALILAEMDRLARERGGGS